MVTSSEHSEQAQGAGNSTNTVMSRDGAVPSLKADHQPGQHGGYAGLEGEQMPQEEAHVVVQILFCLHLHNEEGFPGHKHHAGSDRDGEERCLRDGNILHS